MAGLGQYKVFIIVIGAGLLIAGAFFLLSRSSEGGGAAVSLSNDTQQQISLSEQIERELIAELGKLRTIKLNDTLFGVPAFESLVDFSREIEDQLVGRENPFAPLSIQGNAPAPAPAPEVGVEE